MFLWSLQIITLTISALLTFQQSWGEKLLAWLGIEHITLHLCSQQGAHEHSAMVNMKE